ncbi:MAG: phosphate ABC transporter permease subunit PstC [Candidatus Omnitrophica bacterium]|nr:phosphate ABC transporter permease subunit PstC [Candidatus Omnitrophota bacterium]MBU1929382.1 phosphate ABC transporter permease subunit PstC [Candidatus Omnitrophota bacterium]MBU2034878.1 phosphate ABC transporter permease subunit PstC [Candidatus Omnitrophota bacterium]MBU2221209.1 phosphate ABC transporter permease subunit PstC [Candidatus Omnitrophota bacterium]MBU2258211.1 phosphate ABC transporter permease subunit PstC [Candidatus Omnitrophota bacterium]
MLVRKLKELIIEKIIFLCGVLSIIFVGLIFLFLLKEGLALFKFISPGGFLFGKSWYPISEPAQLGVLPLILGSLIVTLGAAVISIPIGVGCAVYIAEVAPAKTKEVLKTGIELLAAIPSVVLGFIGMVTLVPWVKNIFHLPTGLTALSGSIMLAFMAMPTIVSIAEDALYSVPKSYKEGALALGATRWQSIYRVMLPAASSGILAAVMLGLGRVIGETMAVMMITGNAAVIPQSILVPVRTLTATIAAEMGEAVVGSEHYFALFAVGIVLFVISFAINVTADLFLHKKR